jgi:hypothetical protein
VIIVINNDEIPKGRFVILVEEKIQRITVNHLVLRKGRGKSVSCTVFDANTFRGDFVTEHVLERMDNEKGTWGKCTKELVKAEKLKAFIKCVGDFVYRHVTACGSLGSS